MIFSTTTYFVIIARLYSTRSINMRFLNKYENVLCSEVSPQMQSPPFALPPLFLHLRAPV